MKYYIRNLIEKIFGYWCYKVKYLPVGTSLRVDIINRFNYYPLETIFDVGANIGQSFTKFRFYFPKSTIFCFEPILDTYVMLQKNLIHEKQVYLENLAFGEATDTKEVTLFEEWNVLNSLKKESMNTSQDARKQIVKIETIQNYCKIKKITKIDLLKIDTEGYELNVLEGAVNLLKEKKISFILCEVGFLNKNSRNTNFAQLSEFLSNYDYYFVSLYNGSNENWSKGLYYGDALFANSNLTFN